MINEKDIQDRVNRRLSGLAASEQRRMRIRTAINAEREEAQPMKRTISKTLVIAIVAVMLMATVAIAEHFNLFNFFGAHDERYNAVAPHATLTVSEPALVEHPELGTVTASIDSAYFDGLSLNLAYRITQGQKVEEYTPSETELALMTAGNADVLVADFSENEPGIEILRAWNQAVEAGTPYGYKKTTVYTSDHTNTDDGIDLYPDSAAPTYNENGEFCEMREFECPLPDEVRDRKELKVNIGVKQEVVYYWFDGTNCYWRTERADVGTMTATIPLNGESKQYAGTGTINGASCMITAEVSPMAAVMTIECSAPLSTFLNTAPEGTDERDCWVEVIAIDENGNKFRPHGGVALDEGTSFSLSFNGTGTQPQNMNVYLYTMWEEADAPDFATLDSIALTVAQ